MYSDSLSYASFHHTDERASPTTSEPDPKPVMRQTMHSIFPSHMDPRPARSNTAPIASARSGQRASNRPSIAPTPLSTNREEHPQQHFTFDQRSSGPSPYPSVPWHDHDDNILLNARLQGHGWGQIQRDNFPSKSANACRKRYERLVAKKRGTGWDEARLERLGVQYRELREQIWKPLADAMDESWQDVEKACFTRGLKILSTARNTRLNSVDRARDNHGEESPTRHRDGEVSGKATSMPSWDQLLT